MEKEFSSLAPYLLHMHVHEPWCDRKWKQCNASKNYSSVGLSFARSCFVFPLFFSNAQKQKCEFIVGNRRPLHGASTVRTRTARLVSGVVFIDTWARMFSSRFSRFSKNLANEWVQEEGGVAERACKRELFRIENFAQLLFAFQFSVCVSIFHATTNNTTK